MAFNAQQGIAIATDLKIEAIVVINSRLPYTIGSMVFLYAERRIADIAEKMYNLFFKLILNPYGQFEESSLKVRGIFYTHRLVANLRTAK